jgi:hypothetical protein
MTINYSLAENNLTSDPDDYVAMVQPVATAGLEDVIERMVAQGSTVTRADIVSVLEDFHSAVESMVLEGMNVNTPGANFRASIRGMFNGQSDGFDAARHQVWAIATAGSRYRKAIRDRAEVIKQEAVTPRPNPLEYTDMNTDERNSVLTPGGMGQIVGHRLKFDPGDAAQGIFFIAEDGGAETKVDVVGLNKPGSLMCVVPAGLAAGDYVLAVRAAWRDGEDVRTGTLDEVLTVS